MKRAVLHTLGKIPPVRKALPLPVIALASVIAKDGSIVYASSDTLFRGAIFGRDSLEVAEDLMRIKPGLVHNILLTLGGLQGQRYRALSEEEPGKIIHEFRSSIVDGKPLGGTTRQLFEKLNEQWGGNGKVVTYYASVDATPQFLRVLHGYCQLYGNAILAERPKNRTQPSPTMREIIEQAIDWMMRQLNNSRSGLLEYKSAGPSSGRNHVWKDSQEFYVHHDKELVNHDMPVASIEVQGLVYDALMAAAYFLPEHQEAYRQRAKRLRDRTIELLWQPDKNYFALGLDFAPHTGELRLIRTTTSNPADLLDSAFFDELPPVEAQQYISAIVQQITSSEFLTNAGVRSRSLREADLIPFWDYHGSYVSWPKDTYDIAKGLRRQGFPRLAAQLENRLVNLVRKTRDYPEFVYVDGRGRVLSGVPRTLPSKAALEIQGTNAPERIQAWTVSAVMAIWSNRGAAYRKPRPSTPAPHNWQHEMEDNILASIHKMKAYRNPLHLRLRYPTYAYHLTDPRPAR